MAKRKKSTALVPLSPDGKQVIDVPWLELKDKDITLQLIQLLRDQPLLAVAAGLVTMEVAEKLGLVSPGVATASQGIMTVMGVASAFQAGGLMGGLLGMAAGGAAANFLGGKGDLASKFLQVGGPLDPNLLQYIPGIGGTGVQQIASRLTPFL